MNTKKTIAFDAKELTQKNLGSLGYMLLEILNNMKDYNIILLSDMPVPNQYIPSNAIAISRNKQFKGGFDLLKYQMWMKKVMKNKKINSFFQINHFSVIKLKQIKSIVVVHDLFCLEQIEKRSLAARIKYYCSMIGTMIFADEIITVSNFTKKRLEHYFWKSAKITVSYCGVRPPLSLSNESYKIIDGKFCLILGRVNYYKRTMRIVDFYDKNMSDSGYKLVIAGQAKLKSVADQMSYYTQKNSNIIWLNYVDDYTKEWLLKNTSLLIYASRYDGFGVPPLEAAIRKKKVVISDIEVLREVTQNKGVYIDFERDDKYIRETIMNTLQSTNDAIIEDMYNVARSYSWKKFADTLIDLIEKNDR